MAAFAKSLVGRRYQYGSTGPNSFDCRGLVYYGTNSVTHSAIYVGNGQIVHATNPRMGVRLSNLNSWVSCRNCDDVKTVRRVS